MGNRGFLPALRDPAVLAQPPGVSGPHLLRHGGDSCATFGVHSGRTDRHPIHEAGAQAPETALQCGPAGPGPPPATAGGWAGRPGLVPASAALAPTGHGHPPAGRRCRILEAADARAEVPPGQPSRTPYRSQLEPDRQRGPTALGDKAGLGLLEGPQLPRGLPGDRPGRLLLHLLQGAARRRGLPAGAEQRPAHHAWPLQAHLPLPRGAGAAGEPAVPLWASNQPPCLVGQQLPGGRGAPGRRRGGGGPGAR
ncbi:hypothetical protein GH733_003795 [Mirounga leonina]|nr:hypothetical protein GH733_003795 [Mirounga leonina]